MSVGNGGSDFAEGTSTNRIGPGSESEPFSKADLYNSLLQDTVKSEMHVKALHQ